MEVQLLVYDLSGGLARQMSMGILGFQLNAIYHTSIEIGGREYVYDGGIIAITPGSSHHGRPLEKIRLGITNLPMDVIHEYLDSVRSIFTAEAYDLFKHNCNNFTDSFSKFLTGEGIPSRIASMPQAVMDSPLGRMLVPQLTQGMNAARGRNGSVLGLEQTVQAPPKTFTNSAQRQGVKMVTGAREFSGLLEKAKDSSAIIFFTSSTCAPCKLLYPAFDELAEEHRDKVTFIKVDISQPQNMELSSRFSVRATPTLVTMLKGQEESRWTGADPAKLRGNVQLLAQMAFPMHPHEKLRLPSFSNAGQIPVTFSKTPPMAKLMVKMGDQLAKKPEVQSLKSFIETRAAASPQDAVVPELSGLSSFLQESVKLLAPEVLFAVIDLFRCALVDPRISGYYAEEAQHQTVHNILEAVNALAECPYALRLVTLQMASNFFSSPLFWEESLRDDNVRTPIIRLISSSFLDDSHNNIRVAASSLLFNIALANRKARNQPPRPGLPDEDQVELAASVVEAISQEDKSAEALQGMLSGLGHLVYRTELDGELADLLRALDAEGAILAKKKIFPNERLVAEVGAELLGKGLRRL